jgi:hypothetical protein
MPVRPKFRDCFPDPRKIEDALCVAIYVVGRMNNHSVNCSDIYAPLADFFSLSTLSRSLLRSDYYEQDQDSGLAWDNVVQWARKTLKDDGYLATSPHGVWKLSEGGIKKAIRLLPRFEEQRITALNHVAPSRVKPKKEVSLNDLDLHI